MFGLVNDIGSTNHKVIGFGRDVVTDEVADGDHADEPGIGGCSQDFPFQDFLDITEMLECIFHKYLYVSKLCDCFWGAVSIYHPAHLCSGLDICKLHKDGVIGGDVYFTDSDGLSVKRKADFSMGVIVGELGFELFCGH